ncbi:MAG: hypothetical protein Q8M03_04655 [Legionella sp.]|nr:hypothetical protein [Legionella sp.]
MNEIDILRLFYDEMTARSATREVVFLNIDEAAVMVLSEKLKTPVSLEEAHRLTDICIANEWLERTTIDPGYNFLSLTQAGLQIVLASEYT